MPRSCKNCKALATGAQHARAHTPKKNTANVLRLRKSLCCPGQALRTLVCKLADEPQGEASVLRALDELVEVVGKQLKDQAEVPLVLEASKEAHCTRKKKQRWDERKQGT
jgi:hypothetical protein